MSTKKRNDPESADAVKLSFVLTEAQAGPSPLYSETLWCCPEGENFRVRNIPFFIDEVALDDVVAVRALPDGYFEIDRVVAPSGNSTVWIYFNLPAKEDDVIDDLIALGCGVEGGVMDDYYAINVPRAVDIKLVYSLVDRATAAGVVSADYPAIRH